ncbi:MAG: ATP-binding protein [Desulfomonilia bacterium]
MGLKQEKAVYTKLGEKINNLTVRTPLNETFYSILKELYTTEEADVVANMPYTLSSLDRISRATRIETDHLRDVLGNLCLKGLVMDFWNESENQYYYMPSPLAVGIFEFTMMRKGKDLNSKQLAHLFHDYFCDVFPANFSQNEQISIMRVIPVEETIPPEKGMEFLDYEKASSIIDDSKKFAIGVCSCRNEKNLLGEKLCDVPLDGCSMFNIGADYMIRNHLAREVTKSEMQDNFARSREYGLVFCSWNTQKNPMAVCHCCKCCCNYLSGLSKFGYLNSVITSTFLSHIDTETCTGCGKCVEVCPVNAIGLVSANDPKNKKKKMARVDERICIGCGVCALKCPTGSAEMIERGSRVIHPETMFEATILATLERGSLQNQLFDDPHSRTHEFMRTFVGAFLRLPLVKKALMSDVLRSSFLNVMKQGAKLQGKGWMTEM